MKNAALPRIDQHPEIPGTNVKKQDLRRSVALRISRPNAERRNEDAIDTCTMSRQTFAPPVVIHHAHLHSCPRKVQPVLFSFSTRGWSPMSLAIVIFRALLIHSTIRHLFGILSEQLNVRNSLSKSF
ncbi:hypothetical protein GWC77_26020 [Paraburkholderia sp. NMBU_R16]|uniref:hypothetical protein n=1 Tax=Paraburkholderia sp. NMBU_R16 TaxID=2698676 RepID=UPI0015672D96|nr:hypothetical protein [Paraburkholderia sp. NMBU_R16]NRO99347.1 hypothetical protein [Paraburkholderia sp. NMBU_R16]